MHPFDIRLIRLLARDPRRTYQNLADHLDCSRATVRKHVQELMRAGALSITALAHPYTRGLRVAAELLIDTDLPSAEVAASLLDRAYASTASAQGMVTVSAWCGDDEELIGLADHLRGMDGVRGVEVFRVVHLLRSPLPTPIRFDLATDEIDHRLMRLLAHVPRAPYTRLGDQVGLTQTAARTRVLRLQSTGALRLQATTWNPDLRVTALRVGVSVNSPALAVARDLLRLPGLTYLAVGHGHHDILAHLTTTGGESALRRKIHAMPGVSRLHVWHRSPTPYDHLALLDLPGKAL